MRLSLTPRPLAGEGSKSPKLKFVVYRELLFNTIEDVKTMFTGCIDHCGHLVKIEDLAAGKRFHISSRFQDFQLGESIAVNGVCLSVVQTKADEFIVDVSPETLKVANFSALQSGCLVNLERSMRLNERLNGHFVLGHVDTTAILTQINSYHDFMEYSFEIHDSQSQFFLVKKGCVAINGVSLTLNHVEKNRFTVMLIPDTLAKTNLSALRPQDHVTIEYDYLAKLTFNQNKILKKAHVENTYEYI